MASSGKSQVFLDVDIDESRERYRLAQWFVENWGESCGFARKGQRLEELKNSVNGPARKKLMKAVRESFQNSYVAQQEAIVRIPKAHARGESPLRCATRQAPERIVVKLWGDISPLAVKNFRMLAQGVPGDRGRVKIGKGGKPLSYEGIPFHRIVNTKDLNIVQGGDITMGNGCGGEPAINNGKAFKDDRKGLMQPIDRRGLLCMCNTGKNTNTSQFFFSFKAQPKLKGKHVVFGEIVSGAEVLDRIEKESKPDGKYIPTIPVVIADAGLLES